MIRKPILKDWNFTKEGCLNPLGVRKFDLREVNLSTGEVIRSVNLSADEFAEGLTFVGDQIIQLTWKEGIAYRYDVNTFEVVGNHTYSGEGWGLAYDGNRLIMSDGSDVLQFRNASTFELESTLNVTLNNESLGRLNELEMFQGLLLANVYQTEQIVGIDLVSGVVVWDIDASGLKTDGGEVLNGIAHDDSTGSLWILEVLVENVQHFLCRARTDSRTRSCRGA